MTNAMKGISVIKRLSKMLSRNSLLTMYKSFVRPQNIETVQYNAALAITGAIKGTSQIKLYNELDLVQKTVFVF